METLVRRAAAPLDAEPETPAGPGDGASDPRGRSQQVAVAVVVALLVALFLANAASWIASGFGESHDGRNAATWASGSRALRDEGVASSRFGGRSPGLTYASHPPGIIAETTAAELVAGEHPLVTRAPAWIGSIAVAVLLALLLWELGLSAGAIAAGLSVALSSAMFLVYGTMLDTPMTALPFALAVVLVTQRLIDGRRVRLPVLGILALAVALSGWAAVAIAATQAVRLALPSVRRRNGWKPALTVAAGLAAGVATSLAWSLWAYGSFAVMRAKLTDKTNSDTLTEALASQAEHLTDLLALGIVLGVIGFAIAWIALPDRRWRGAFLSTLAAIAGYALVLHGGAAMHDYWNYALIVPVAIAVAAGAEALLRRVPERSWERAQRWTIVAVVLVAVLSTTYVSDAEAEQVNGRSAARLLAAAEDAAPPTGPVLAYLGTRGLEPAWIPYDTGRPGLPIRSTGELRELVAEDPGFPMLVPWVRFSPEAQEQIREAAFAVEGPFAVAPAETVLEVRGG